MNGVAVHAPRKRRFEEQVLLEEVKGAFYLDAVSQEEQLPVGGELSALFGMWWRQDVGSMLVPHLPSHDASVVGAIPHCHDRCIIHKIR